MSQLIALSALQQTPAQLRMQFSKQTLFNSMPSTAGPQSHGTTSVCTTLPPTSSLHAPCMLNTLPCTMYACAKAWSLSWLGIAKHQNSSQAIAQIVRFTYIGPTICLPVAVQESNTVAEQPSTATVHTTLGSALLLLTQAHHSAADTAMPAPHHL